MLIIRAFFVVIFTGRPALFQHFNLFDINIEYSNNIAIVLNIFDLPFNLKQPDFLPFVLS
jgi:hypothetical protein